MQILFLSKKPLSVSKACELLLENCQKELQTTLTTRVTLSMLANGKHSTVVAVGVEAHVHFGWLSVEFSRERESVCSLDLTAQACLTSHMTNNM